MADDPYQVLGVERGADLAEIRRAYLAQLRATHPDVRPGDPAAEDRTRELNRAWELVRAGSAGRRSPQPGNGPTNGQNGSRPRQSQPAYSARQREFRTAFTTATLRVGFAILALGLLLLAFGR